jgi:ATP-binding cassette subfamily B protein RaxB
MQFFESRHSGDIISRFSSISTIQHGLTTNLAEGLMDGILAIVTLVAMFAYDVSLTFGSIAVCLLYLIFRICFYSPLKSASAEQIIHSSKQGTHFLESVRGIQSIKIFNKPMERKVAWMNFLANQFSAEARISKISITQQAANGVLFSTEKIVIILFGAMAVLKSEITIGMLFAFISYKDQFTQRISSLIDKFFELKMLNLHAERLSDIVDAIAEDDSYDSKISTIDGDISITLKDVSFRYSRYENFVLKNVNLHIPAGQCIAITGASGSGKSTLLKLLLGLIVPTEGEILINNVSLSKIGIPSYRNLLGAVMQDDCLFSGTIADNISFFDSPLDFERIGIAAQLASVHSDISAMPMGYNTLIGDIGSGLSGGQKQRVLLARALYKIPLLVVLDEATSHLDVENEAMVNQAVTALSLTRIIVAHRPSTIAMAERVVELAHGSIRFDKLNPGRKNIIATKPGSFAGSFKTRDISKPSIRSVLHR